MSTTHDNGARLETTETTPEQPGSRDLWRQEELRVGRFDIRPEEDAFPWAGRITGHTIVFPSSAVRICPESEPPVVADSNTVTYYNDGDRYVREPVSPEGDHCIFLEVDRNWLAGVYERLGSPERGDAARPFDFRWGPSRPQLAIATRRLAAAIESRSTGRLEIEETALTILEGALGAVERHRERNSPPPRRRDTAERHRRLVESVKELLAATYREELGLGQIARRVGASPFHLSRVFQANTGRTLHDYRLRLRLNAALDLLPDAEDLSRVALELGFSSHSHFTASFRRCFGTTPSEYRDRRRRRASRVPSSPRRPRRQQGGRRPIRRGGARKGARS